jgi:hypothetical protein
VCASGIALQRREHWQLDFRSLRFRLRTQRGGLTQVWQAPQSAGAAGPVEKESGGEGVTAVLAVRDERATERVGLRLSGRAGRRTERSGRPASGQVRDPGGPGADGRVSGPSASRRESE